MLGSIDICKKWQVQSYSSTLPGRNSRNWYSLTWQHRMTYSLRLKILKPQHTESTSMQYAMDVRQHQRSVAKETTINHQEIKVFWHLRARRSKFRKRLLWANRKTKRSHEKHQAVIIAVIAVVVWVWRMVSNKLNKWVRQESYQTHKMGRPLRFMLRLGDKLPGFLDQDRRVITNQSNRLLYQKRMVQPVKNLLV